MAFGGIPPSTKYQNPSNLVPILDTILGRFDVLVFGVFFLASAWTLVDRIFSDNLLTCVDVDIPNPDAVSALAMVHIRFVEAACWSEAGITNDSNGNFPISSSLSDVLQHSVMITTAAALVYGISMYTMNFFFDRCMTALHSLQDLVSQDEQLANSRSGYEICHRLKLSASSGKNAEQFTLSFCLVSVLWVIIYLGYGQSLTSSFELPSGVACSIDPTVHKYLNGTYTCIVDLPLFSTVFLSSVALIIHFVLLLAIYWLRYSNVYDELGSATLDDAMKYIRSHELLSYYFVDDGLPQECIDELNLKIRELRKKYDLSFFIDREHWIKTRDVEDLFKNIVVPTSDSSPTVGTKKKKGKIWNWVLRKLHFGWDTTRTSRNSGNSRRLPERGDNTNRLEILRFLVLHVLYKLSGSKEGRLREWLDILQCVQPMSELNSAGETLNEEWSRLEEEGSETIPPDRHAILSMSASSGSHSRLSGSTPSEILTSMSTSEVANHIVVKYGWRFLFIMSKNKKYREELRSELYRYLTLPLDSVDTGVNLFKVKLYMKSLESMTHHENSWSWIDFHCQFSSEDELLYGMCSYLGAYTCKLSDFALGRDVGSRKVIRWLQLLYCFKVFWKMISATPASDDLSRYLSRILKRFLRAFKSDNGVLRFQPNSDDKNIIGAMSAIVRCWWNSDCLLDEDATFLDHRFGSLSANGWTICTALDENANDGGVVDRDTASVIRISSQDMMLLLTFLYENVDHGSLFIQCSWGPNNVPSNDDFQVYWKTCATKALEPLFLSLLPLSYLPVYGSIGVYRLILMFSEIGNDDTNMLRKLYILGHGSMYGDSTRGNLGGWCRKYFKRIAERFDWVTVPEDWSDHDSVRTVLHSIASHIRDQGNSPAQNGQPGDAEEGSS